MILKTNILIGILLFSISITAQTATKLKPTKSISIKVPEPSDICYSPKNDSFFIVSDTGILFETNLNGDIIRKQEQKDTDFEAVYSDNKYVYAVDESNRTIYQYNIADLKKVKETVFPYNGARNKGYESFTYDEIKKRFLLITESEPTIIFELDDNFNITKQTDISSIASDISSARFYKNNLWLLSDEDMMLIKVNPETYEVIKKWKLPIINPEGLAFDKNGNLLITSDDMQRLFFFNNPEN
ncbi:SdiA-regulated domain-containing protein [Flavobacterium sp. SUN052]|uniref:SdiA-regulated domain-containing protein n=1 Tax=Flavobacterium sp. SUN052 TaxID=3002441 RepID=UPI00237E2C03|nr:SdiA-regulated domain-containing protein [Flavobacterium sp. SUN052]MEC4004803.1 SdiA-regulated domain-containing protein [Flavobacterium sp. SUN052]